MDAPPHTKAELKVLKRITPASRIPAVVPRVLRQVQEAIKRLQLSATVRLGGSMAKGTYLKGDHDVDVFVRFSGYEDDSLSDRLERLLKSVFRKVERVHGSRDYFHVQHAGFTFEFIPVQQISAWAEARNVTDMSPLHVEYVADHIRARPWLGAEIRLTKQFAKAAKVYGAESYIGGFSGHVIDLLNIHYGGFRNLLAAASSWQAKTVIDPGQHHDNPLVALNDAKTYAPLVIVDPIQPDRNSAAAVTEAAFRRFKALAREYLAALPEQQELFFVHKPLTATEFADTHRGKCILTVALQPLRGKKDVVGAKCLKVYEFLLQQLAKHGFSCQGGWEFHPDRAVLFFAVDPEPLGKYEEIPGPPVHRTADVERFKNAHKTVLTRDGKVHAIELRKYRDAGKLLQAALKTNYVKERVRGAKHAAYRSSRA